MLGVIGRVFDAIEEGAQKRGIAVVACAVDEHGNTILLMRMKGSQLHALDFAPRKAFTAISMNMPTVEITPLVEPGQPLFGLTEASCGRLVHFGGGDVFELAPGERVGIGISGGTTEQDIELLAEAIARVGEEADAGAGA